MATQNEERLTIKAQLNDTVSFREHFQRLQNLKNSNIVKYNSYELKEENSCVITTDPIAGKYLGTLENCVPDSLGNLKIELNDVLWSIASGLEYLHQRSIVHGQLRLASVFLFKSGLRVVAKISDYGLQQKVAGTIFSNSINKDILDLGNLFQEILNILESGHSCPLVWNIDEKKKPLLSELITILTQDGRPGCELLVYHPYFILTSESARYELVKLWQVEEHREKIVKHFKSEEYAKWLSTINNSLSDHLKGEEFLQYLAEEEEFDVSQSLQHYPWSFTHFLWHILKITSNEVKYFRNEKEKLGEGGYGAVYSGTMIKRNQIYQAAFKKAKNSDAKFSEREKRIKDLNHHFVVKFYGIYKEGNIEWLVMERCAGDLKKFIENQLGSLKDVIDSKAILVQLSVGLSYLHEKGIVHRDLKPENILLNEISPQVLFKLADFGLSKQQHLTPTGAAEFSNTAPSGTSGYMAPEILKADGNMEPNFKSDIWALGVIFFYVLSNGQHPFGKSIPMALRDFRDVIIQTTKNLRNIHPLSHDWAAADLVLQLLQYDPGNRPSSFLIILHPYFSLHNQSTQLFLAKQLFDLYENKTNFSLRLDGKQLKDWYKSREETSDEDKKSLKDLEDMLTVLDPDDKSGILENLQPPPSTKLNEDFKMEQLNVPKLIKKRLGLVFYDVLHAIESAPRFFASYCWYVLKQFNWSAGDSQKLFHVTGLSVAAIFFKFDHFSQMWQNTNNEERNQEISNLLHLAVITSNENILNTIIENGYRIPPTSSRKSLLHYAAMSSNPQIIKILLNKGLSVTAEDENGNTPLHYAAQANSNPEVIAILLEQGASVNAAGKFGNTPLHEAAGVNINTNVIRILIEKGALITAIDKVGNSALHYAAMWNKNSNIIQTLVKNGASVAAVSSNGVTPLHLAARENNNPEILQCLLQHGASVEAVYGFGIMPLHEAAIWSKNPKIIETLLTNSAPIEAVDKLNNTPLHHAARCNTSPDVIRLLLEHKANLSAADKMLDTPLHKAVMCTVNDEIVQVLLEYGASVTVTNKLGQTPLHKAVLCSSRPNIAGAMQLNRALTQITDESDEPVLKGTEWKCKIDIITLLLKYEASMDAVDNFGFTPLHLAIRENNEPATIQFLLENRASVSIADNECNTVLHSAIEENSNAEIIQLLLNFGSSPSAIDKLGNTPLHKATAKNRPEIIEMLINHDAQVMARNEESKTPLHYAAEATNDSQVIKLLIEHGASVMAQDKKGNTSLHYAAYANHPEIMFTLMSEGALVTEENNFGETPLHFAAKHNLNPEVTRMLMDNGASVKAADFKGNTPLHSAAAENKNPKIVRILMETASVDAVNEELRTPLHKAAKSNNPEIVLFLIQHRASTTAACSMGNTPLHYAARWNQNPEVCRILLSNGASATAIDHFGNSTVHYAALGNNNHEVIKILLEHGASPTCVNRWNNSPLHYAAVRTNEPEVINILLENWAPISSAGNLGNTPLHYAARWNGNIDIIRLLLEKNAQVNAVDDFRNTPLHHAARYNRNSDIIKLLVECGAQMWAVNEDGKTPDEVIGPPNDSTCIEMKRKIFSQLKSNK